MNDRLFSSDRVCRIVGVTYRELDYAVRTGVVVPAVEARGSGTHRRFTEDQLRVLRVVAVLADLGAPHDCRARAWRILAQDPNLFAHPAVIDPFGDVWPNLDSAPSGYLVDLPACWEYVDTHLGRGTKSAVA